MRAVLAQLERREALFLGASTAAQPYIEGMRVEHAIVVPGYDWVQIEDCLKFLASHNYVHTGGVMDELSIGIWFGGITSKGRAVISSQLAG
jgi:hypothetical protein